MVVCTCLIEHLKVLKEKMKLNILCKDMDKSLLSTWRRETHRTLINISYLSNQGITLSIQSKSIVWTPTICHSARASFITMESRIQAIVLRHISWSERAELHPGSRQRALRDWGWREPIRAMVLSITPARCLAVVVLRPASRGPQLSFKSRWPRASLPYHLLCIKPPLDGLWRRTSQWYSQTEAPFLEKWENTGIQRPPGLWARLSTSSSALSLSSRVGQVFATTPERGWEKTNTYGCCHALGAGRGDSWADGAPWWKKLLTAHKHWGKSKCLQLCTANHPAPTPPSATGLPLKCLLIHSLPPCTPVTCSRGPHRLGWRSSEPEAEWISCRPVSHLCRGLRMGVSLITPLPPVPGHLSGGWAPSFGPDSTCALPQAADPVLSHGF